MPTSALLTRTMRRHRMRLRSEERMAFQPDPAVDITMLLRKVEAGDVAARDQLVTIAYAELRRIAARRLDRSGQGRDHSATTLVHDAYFRLFRDQSPNFANRAHFFACAAMAMRSVLVDRARARGRQKRAGKQRDVFDDLVDALALEFIDVLALEEALRKLGEIDPRMEDIVEKRFFGGMSMDEIATYLNVPLRTVEREWSFARRWLRDALK